jgi:hypothetical protein
VPASLKNASAINALLHLGTPVRPSLLLFLQVPQTSALKRWVLKEEKVAVLEVESPEASMKYPQFFSSQ